MARKDQIALGLNICKHAYPDVVPEKVSILVYSGKLKKQEIKNVLKCTWLCFSLNPSQEWELFVFNFMMSEITTDDPLPAWVPAELTPKLLSIKVTLHLTLLYVNEDNYNHKQQWIMFKSTQNILSPPVKVYILQDN